MRRLVVVLTLIFAGALPAAAQTPNTITTIAGGGTQPTTATSAYLPFPADVVRDTLGNTFISVPSLNTVYIVTSTGTLSAYAGTGISGFSGDGGPASQAQLSNPRGLALDSANELFIADSNNNRIRKVDATTAHNITTVAGSQDPFAGAYAGDGDLATSARLNFPEGVALDANGNIFIADTFNGVVRRVDANSKIITTYAGTQSTSAKPGCAAGPATSTAFLQPVGVTTDAAGDLFISDEFDDIVCKVDASQNISVYAGQPGVTLGLGESNGDGGPATSAIITFPEGIRTDAAGDLFITDSGNGRVREVNAKTNVIISVAGAGGFCSDSQLPSCGDGGAPLNAHLNQPRGVFVDASGMLIADAGDQRVRTVGASGTLTISTLAGGGPDGDGGAATSAILGIPQTITVDTSENVFALETAGERLREISGGKISTIAGDGISGGTLGTTNGDGGAALHASFVSPTGVSTDNKGIFYIVDRTQLVVLAVNTTTSSQTIAGVTVGPNDMAVVAGNGQSCSNPTPTPSCGDGGSAVNATFIFPTAAVPDGNGNIYISDGRLNTVRVVNSSGVISTFAGKPGTSCNTFPTNCGDGGSPASALLNFPDDVVAAPSVQTPGKIDVFIADSNDNVIREVSGTTGLISTVAFNGVPGFGGDGGSALFAEMNFPEQIAVDEMGNIYIGGGNDNVVVRVDVASGTIKTVAGDVNNLGGGFSGDGGPSTQAMISNYGLAIAKSTTTPGTHDLFIADSGSNRTRKVNLAPVSSAVILSGGSSFVFPATLLGATSDAQVLTITNSGLDSLVISNVPTTPISSVFAITNECVTPVAPGSSCDLLLALAPPVGTPTGAVAGTLSFNTNDPAKSSYSFSLSGTASNSPVTLMVTTSGTGTLTSDPAGITCPDACSASFASGAQVTLIAGGIGADAFTSWNSGNFPGNPCNGITVPECTVTMPTSGPVTVGANFTPANFTITVNVTGAGSASGSVTSTPQNQNSITCTAANSPCAFVFPLGTSSVTLSETPSGSGTVFAGWLGLSCASAGVGACTTTGATQTVGAVFSGPAQAFAKGDVLFSTDDGMVFVYTSAATLKEVLNSGTNGGRGSGMAFDPNGNLFLANASGGQGSGVVEIFNTNAGGPTIFANGSFVSPYSVVADPFDNIYVGQIPTSEGFKLPEFAGESGSPTSTFFPAFEGPASAATWLELLGDNQTLAYTLGTHTVKIFDTSDFTQHADLSTSMHGAFALRQLPDSSILVADSDRIVRLSSAGALLQTYTPGTNAIFVNLNLDPDGQTFWTNDEISGTVFRLNISSGAIISQFNTPLGITASVQSLGIGGIAVFGGQQSGAGADLAITMNAPTNAQVGANLTYTLTITNNGPDAATGVVVSDTLPSGLTADLATDFTSNCTGTDILACTIGNLGVGQTATVLINVVPTATTTLQNTATVSGNQVDPNTANNTATGSTTVVTNGVPVTVEAFSTNPADFVTSSPAGINCGAAQVCTVFYASGTTLTLTANGPNFVSWTVFSPPGATCPATPTCVLSNLTVQAFVVANYASGVGFTVPPGAALGKGVVGVPYAVDLSQGILPEGNAPYTFSVSAGSLPPGLSLSGSGPKYFNNRLSGTPTTAGTSNFTITVTDSSTPTPQTSTLMTSITIINPPSGQEALLNGLYAILFRGVSDADASLRDFVASVPFDGQGHILAGGSFDANGNGTNGTLQTGLTISGGTYTIGNDFRGLANVILSDGTTRIFAFSVGDVYKTTGLAYSIYLIEFDDNSGTGIRGAGLGKRQDTTAFTPASIAGTYVVGRTGESTTLQRFTESGLVGLNASGQLTALSEEFNNNGTTGTDTLVSGTYGTDGSNGLISATGRTQEHVMFTDTPTGGTSTTKTADTALVIVDANTLFALKIVSGATETLFAGIDHRQLNLGNFSPSSINGPYVLNLQGPFGANTSSQAEVVLGLLDTNGSTAMTVTEDVNNAGGILENFMTTGTVGAASNGRATFSFAGIALTAYFWDLNHAFAMSSAGADPGFGTIELQHGGPFPTGPFTDFTFGTLEPASPSGGPVTAGVFTVSETPFTFTANLTQDVSHERGTLEHGTPSVFEFSESAAGRVVDVESVASDPSFTFIGYNVSPSRGFDANIDPTDNHPHIVEVISTTMPPGMPSPLTTTIAFGSVAKGSTATMPFTLTNVGDGLLSITGFTNAVDFTITGPCVGTLPTAPVVLPAQGGSCTGTITFNPAASTSPGAVSEAIPITTDFGTATLNMTGTVTPAGFTCDSNWTGGGGDNQWTTATNWSNGIPTSSQGACILGFSSSTIKIGTLAAANQVINTLDSDASLDLQGGPLSLKAAIAAANAVTIESGTTLTLNGAGTIGGSLTLSGTLTGTGAITVTGPITWNGNALMTGTGSTTANGGITFNIPAGMDAGMGSRTLNNAGTATWPGVASEGLLLDSSAVVNNLAGGTWNFASDNGVSGDGTGIFNNAGTFEKTGGTVASTIQVPFNNTGSVSVTASATSLIFANGGSCGSACGGSFNVGTGATLNFGGGTFALKGQIAGPGAIRFAGVTVSSTGAYNVTGGTTVSGGIVNFNSGASVTSLGPLTVSGGTLNFSTGNAIPVSTITLAAGALAGTDTVNLNGLLTWEGGTMSGTGITNANGGIAFPGSGTTVTLDTRTLNNAGTATWTGTAASSLAMANSSVVNNTTTGIWNFQDDSGIGLVSGTPVFNNAGKFQKTGGTASPGSTIGVVFNNSGTVAATTGALNFNNSYAQTAGSTSLDGGTITIIGSQTLSGSGTISGNVVNSVGTVTPGTPTAVGSLTINGTGEGNYSGSGGNYTVKIGGVNAGQFDTTTISGTATVGGLLTVTLVNGFTPSAGQSFQILTAGSLTGTFSNLSGLPTLPGGLTWKVTYTTTAVTLNVVAASGTFTLTVLDNGVGTGMITGTGGINCLTGSMANCTANIASGTAVTLTASPAAGSTFTAWNAASTQCVGSTNPVCSFTMPASNQNVEATFNVSSTMPQFGNTTLAAGAVGVPYGADIPVTGGNPPYTFSLANGSTLPTGFNLDTTASGNVSAGHVFNNSPAATGNLTFSVIVTDNSGNTAGPATITIPINAAPANTQAALVKGQWVLLERSFSEGSAEEDGALASLNFDGVSAVTGVVDINQTSGIQQQLALTGTYAVAADNTMFVTLTAPNSACTSPPCTVTFVMAVGNVYRGQAYSAAVAQFNDDDGNDSIGSGFMLRSDPTVFNNNSIAGTDIFGLTGQTTSLQRVAETGIITFDNALNVKSGSADVNKAGTLGSITSITGTYTTPDANGHTVLSVTQTPGSASQTSVYIVSANELVAMSLDSRTNNALLIGTALRQVAPAGGFGAGSVAGPDVLTLEDLESDGGFDVIVGLATVSSGTLSVTFDEESDGQTPTIGGVTSGPVTVGTNGRLSSQLTAGAGSGSTLIAYLATPGRGFVIGSGSGVPAGELKPQVVPGSGFSTTPFSGNIFFGLQEILGANSSISGVGALQSGTASFNITDSESHNGGDLSFHQSAGVLTLTVASNGSFIGQGTAGIGSTAGYLVSPFEFDIIDTTDSSGSPSVHPQLIVAQTQTAPPGTPSPAAPTIPFATPVTVGQTATSAAVTITNTGLGPLGFTGVNAGESPDFKVDPSSTCFSATTVVVVLPMGTCTVLTDFAPTTSTPTGTTLSETLILQTDGTANVTITDTGTAQAATTPDFSLAVTPGSQTVPSSTGSTSYTVTPTALNGFSGNVTLAISGLPLGATGTFSVNPILVGQSPITSTLTVTTSTTPPGTYTLTITGTSGSLKHTATTTLVVTASTSPDFSLSAAPGSQTVTAGGNTAYTVNAAALNGFTGTVALTLAGLPTGATGTFKPASIASGTPSTLTVTTATTTPAGTSTLTITGMSGTLVHTATVQLVVTSAPDFSLSATPGSQTVTAGNNTTYTVNATALNAFTGTVALTLAGLPTGATGTFQPASIATGTPSTLTVTTATTTPAGTSMLTITGTSGSLVHTATVQLVVNQVLASINVTPGTVTLLAGNTQQYLATGIFGDKSTQNLTSSVTWASSNTAVATISNASGSQGLATAVKAGGPVTISATQGSIQGTATLNVTDFTLSATPPSQTVNAGNGATFTVNAAALNGFTGNVALTLSGQPTGVTGTFTPNSIAPGTPSTLNVTVPTATPAGTYTLTIAGSNSGVSHTATVQLVVNQVLVSLAITPNPASVGLNNTLQLTATGTFGDKSTQNLTNSVTWSSSDTTTATISNATGSQGLATGVKAGGPITITATEVQDKISATDQLTVTSLVLGPPPGQPLVPAPIAPGGTLIVPLMLSVPPGTTGTVLLSCTVSSQTIANASQFANCIPVPTQVVLNGSGSVNTALAVKFFCSDVPGVPGFRKMPGGLNGPLGTLLMVLAAAAICLTLRRRPRWAVSFALVALIAIGTSSCSSPQKGPDGAAPAGNYVVTVTATLNNETASVNIPVTVE